MNSFYFIGVAAVLGCLYFWIGMRASKSVQNNDDYFLMGRKLTFFPLCLTFLATQLGGGSLLGTAEEAYSKGWIVFIYPLGASLGFLLLGMGFGSRLRKLNITTVAEIFEQAYGSRKLRLIASGLSIVSFFLILVGQGIAARKFFLAAGMGEAIFVFFWIAFAAYTIMGGLKAVVDTDIIQAVMIILGLLVAWIFIDWSLLPEGASQLLSNPLSTTSEVPWSSWLLMPLLFMLIEQDMGQRCFAAKNAKVVGPSAITASLLLLLSSSIAISFGVFARSLELEVSNGGSILVESVKVLTNPSISLCFMGVVLMAIASSADSILCSISSNLSCDFLSREGIDSKKQIRRSRWLTLVTAFLALIGGYLFDNVVSVLMLAYELSVCALFVPVVMAMFMKTPSRKGAFFSIALGVIGCFVFRSVPWVLPKEVLALLCSFLGYCLGSRLPVDNVCETIRGSTLLSREII